MKVASQLCLATLAFQIAVAKAYADPLLASADLRRTIIELEQQVGRASVQANRTQLQALMASDFVCATSAGRVFGHIRIDRWTTIDPNVTEQEFEIEEATVFDQGSSAVVVAVTKDTWLEAGRKHHYRERVFDVWQHRGKRWVWIASTSTKLDAS